MDDITHDYIMQAVHKPDITEIELKETLELYISDPSFVESLIALHNQVVSDHANTSLSTPSTIQPSTDTPADTPANNPITVTTQPVPTHTLTPPTPLDKTYKKSIVDKYSYIPETGPSANMVLPRYLSAPKDKKKSDNRFYNGIIVTSKGEKYVST